MNKFMSRGAGSAFGGKKLLFVLPVVALLAAGCNSQQPTLQNNQPVNNPSAQQQAQAPSATQPTQQQTDPTADWKTYSDAKNGFEIKYPAQQWSVKTSNDTVNISLDRPNSESPMVQVTVSGQTVAALANQILADIKSDPVQKLISDKNGNFAGIVSREIVYTPTAGGQADFTLLSENGKTYQLLMLDTGEQNNALDIILSTFKFTK